MAAGLIPPVTMLMARHIQPIITIVKIYTAQTDNTTFHRIQKPLLMLEMSFSSTYSLSF